MAQLTTDEAAKMLGVSAATLNEWRVRNEGPAYTKMGRLVRYPDYELERFIRERTVQTSNRKGPQGETRKMGIPIPVQGPPLLAGHRFRGRSRKRLESASPESCTF